MKKAGRVLSRVGIGVVILAVLVGTFGTYYLKSYIPNTVAPKSFPKIDGEIQLAGLDGPVDIYPPYLCIQHARSVHGAGLRARPGPFLANGFLAAYRIRSTVRDVR